MRELLFCLQFLGGVAWRIDRRRLIVGAALLLVGAVATPLVALTLKGLVDNFIAGEVGRASMCAIILAMALIAELMMGHFAHLYYFELAEVTEASLNRRLLRLINGTRGLDQCDDPAFADGVDLLRQDIVASRMTVQAAMQLITLALQAGLTAVVLVSVQPVLLLLPLVAAAPVVLGKRAEAALEHARQSGAATSREVKHLRSLASHAESQKEIRISGAQRYLIERQQTLQDNLTSKLSAGYRKHAWLRSGGQLTFALAYAGSVALLYRQASEGRATVGEVVLVIALATQISSQVATALQLLGTVYAAAAGLRRFAALEAAGQGGRDAGVGIALDRLEEGISFEHVGFTYPGAGAPVLHDVNLRLPAGAVVALVGENGAGKSTMVKLLTGLYAPTSGRVFVDRQDLAQVDAGSWRERTATLFQDFAQFDLSLRESIGVGQLAHIANDTLVSAALARAKASALLERVDAGLDTLLGRGYGDGAELSGGQWQSVGFARAMMRESPLMLSLDEPGHALDPFAEQRMCDAYEQVARDVAARVGGVTVFVTHRLSTVRLADVIVVMANGRVVEVGAHDELIAAAGRYAELWALQSAAYI